MINPLKGIDKSTMDVSEAFKAAAHNTLGQIASNSYVASTAWGAGIGASVGAVNGYLSYDDTLLGGATHGAMLGAAGGAGMRLASEVYAKGAGMAFNKSTGAFNYSYKNGDSFSWSNFNSGWNSKKQQP